MGFSFRGHQTLVPHWGGAAQTYADKTKSVFGASLIAYWPLWEASGIVADNYEGTAARDGAYTGVTLGQTGIGDGRTAPLFDGANDFVNTYSASLSGAFNPAEGTIAAWIKVANAGVWTDGTSRLIFNAYVASTNYIQIQRPTVNNRINFIRRASSSNQAVNFDGQSSTDWLHVALTWSVSANKLIAYLNGVASAPVAGLTEFVGVLDSNRLCIGAFSTVPANPWNGWIAHVAVANAALSPTNVALLAVV